MSVWFLLLAAQLFFMFQHRNSRSSVISLLGMIPFLMGLVSLTTAFYLKQCPWLDTPNFIWQALRIFIISFAYMTILGLLYCVSVGFNTLVFEITRRQRLYLVVTSVVIMVIFDVFLQAPIISTTFYKFMAVLVLGMYIGFAIVDIYYLRKSLRVVKEKIFELEKEEREERHVESYAQKRSALSQKNSILLKSTWIIALYFFFEILILLTFAVSDDNVLQFRLATVIAQLDQILFCWLLFVHRPREWNFHYSFETITIQQPQQVQ
jgi:hypothetical protein